MNTSNVSLIDAVLTEVAAKHGTSAGTLSGLVQRQNHDNVLNRIAMAQNELARERHRLLILDKEDNTTFAKDMPVKPERFLSFCQSTMNQVCWAARRLIKAAKEDEATHDASNADFSSGPDFSEGVNEDLNVESQNETGIINAIKEDFRALSNVHAWLSDQMSYLNDVESLFMYADTQKEGENWILKATADNWDEAVSVMDNVIITMREREEASTSKEASTMDFADVG